MSDFISLFTVILTFVAVVVSAIAAFLAKRAIELQSLASQYTALLTQTQLNEQRLSTNPKLLLLYGIDIEELTKDNLSEIELIYILSDFRQGEVFHRIENYTGDMLSDYRSNFLKNAKVQIAFSKYIYGRLMSKSPYLEAMRIFIEQNPNNQ
jgi:hypothetical protein